MVGEYLKQFYTVGEEIVSYQNTDQLIDKIKFYLMNDKERGRIALQRIQAGI